MLVDPTFKGHQRQARLAFVDRYAQAGLRLFPVLPDSRGTYLKSDRESGLNWTHWATADIDTLAAWWRKWPDARIGWRHERHHLTVDFDWRHGQEHAGWDYFLRELRDVLQVLPETWQVQTPSGGVHYHYLVDPDHGLKSWTKSSLLEHDFDVKTASAEDRPGMTLLPAGDCGYRTIVGRPETMARAPAGLIEYILELRALRHRRTGPMATPPPAAAPPSLTTFTSNTDRPADYAGDTAPIEAEPIPGDIVWEIYQRTRYGPKAVEGQGGEARVNKVLIGIAKAYGLTLGQLWKLAEWYNSQMCLPPWRHDQIGQFRRIVRRAHRKAQEYLAQGAKSQSEMLSGAPPGG